MKVRKRICWIWQSVAVCNSACARQFIPAAYTAMIVSGEDESHQGTPVAWIERVIANAQWDGAGSSAPTVDEDDNDADGDRYE